MATWNVRTLLCTEQTTQRRTAIVGLELKRYDIDIAALCESRFSETGSITETSCGYAFYWSGPPEGERRMHGVCLAIRSDIAKGLQHLPNAINERLITIRLPKDTPNRYVTIIGAYAPTMTYDEITKEVFYIQLDQCIRETLKEDKLIIMGNFDARVGTNHDAWQGTLGLHGIGKCNSNGLLLLTKCMEHELAITNTLFKQPMKNKTTWMHPRSKKWHLIDYTICRNQDLTNVKITKTVRGTNCETDHHMVFCKMKCIIQPPRKKTATTKPKRKFDIARLKQTAVMEDLSNALNTALENQPVIDNSNYHMDHHKGHSLRHHRVKHGLCQKEAT